MRPEGGGWDINQVALPTARPILPGHLMVAVVSLVASAPPTPSEREYHATLSPEFENNSVNPGGG